MIRDIELLDGAWAERTNTDAKVRDRLCYVLGEVPRDAATGNVLCAGCTAVAASDEPGVDLLTEADHPTAGNREFSVDGGFANQD